MFSLIIIDCDGTLVDTISDISGALNNSLMSLGLEPFLRSEIEKYVGSGITPLMEERAAGELLLELKNRFQSAYLDSVCSESRVYPGWDEVLAQTTSFKKVILSNKHQHFLLPLVKGLGIDKEFSACYGRNAFKENKPSPLPVLGIMKEFKVKPSEVLIVGDMPADILSGKAAGIVTVGVLFGYGSKEILEECSPDYYISSPVELLKILKVAQ